MKNGPKIALVSGFWGQNIGNAFFNIGGLWLLRRAFPDASVEFILDAPGYRTFNNQRKGNPTNDWDLLSRLDCDYLVLQGPLLTTTFPALWRKTLGELRSRGTRVILLSAGLFRYTKEEIEVNREFIKEVNPVIFSTRDFPTYEAFKDCCEHSYAGIDSAFFSPDAHQPFKLSTKPYITVNYDRFPEPDISFGAQKNPTDTQFTFLDKEWNLHFPRLLEYLSHKGKIQSYFSSLLDRRKMPAEIGGYEVVRPEHRVNPHVAWKIYKNPNAVASDEPWTYYTVYANTSLTISDRVHACVTTLAYGKPAILYKHSKRAFLFDRLGLADIGKKAMTLDPSYLLDEKAKLIHFLESAWSQIRAKQK